MNFARLPELKSDLWAGLRQGVLFGAAALVLILPPQRPPMQPARTTSVLTASQPPVFHDPDFALLPASTDARLVVGWVAESADNRGLPYVVLDKRDARVYVFTSNGRFLAQSPVLLGAAPGDDAVAGIGTRPIAQVRPEERTTPAGRFVSAPGKNASNEDVVWVDYDDAVSMHRVRPIDPKERRLERLASPDPKQRRISYGCINVPVAFFESVVWPLLGAQRAVVYVLPETRDVHQVFAGVSASRLRTASSRELDARL